MTEIDLKLLLEDAKVELNWFDIRKRSINLGAMFGVNQPLHWLTDVPAGYDPNHVKAMLLGVELPTIYVHEGKDGDSFSVIRGAALVETFRYLYNTLALDRSLIDDPLVRRLRDTAIRVVILRTTMSYTDAKTIVNWIDEG